MLPDTFWDALEQGPEVLRNRQGSKTGRWKYYILFECFVLLFLVSSNFSFLMDWLIILVSMALIYGLVTIIISDQRTKVDRALWIHQHFIWSELNSAAMSDHKKLRRLINQNRNKIDYYLDYN